MQLQKHWKQILLFEKLIHIIIGFWIGLINWTRQSPVSFTNQIGDEGAITFAEALKINSTLQEINLEGNKISDKGASAIAKELKTNSTLQERWWCYCNCWSIKNKFNSSRNRFI